eukprot:jgi/Tetstr1/428402/TSEL_001840.t1
MVESEYYTHHKKSVAWFNPDMFNPNVQQKLKNLGKQPARQALERMRGGHLQRGATVPTTSASASAGSAATTDAPAKSATGGA